MNIKVHENIVLVSLLTKKGNEYYSLPFLVNRETKTIFSCTFTLLLFGPHNNCYFPSISTILHLAQDQSIPSPGVLGKIDRVSYPIVYDPLCVNYLLFVRYVWTINK